MLIRFFKKNKVAFVASLATGLTAGAASLCYGSSSAVPGSDPNIFVNLAKKVVPSVVNISTLTTIKTPSLHGGPDEFFRKFFEDFFKYHNGGRGGSGGREGEDEDDGPSPRGPAPKNAPKAISLGTGFIIDSSGLILTNNHVVAEADEIKIQFTEETNEKPTDGEVVGRDPELDLALIKVKNKRQMIPLTLGDSDALEVGEYVIAVGNPFGQGHSVTHGIISAKERRIPDFIFSNYLQTDAPINPGNSGGPLLNLKGEVVGINNAIDQRAQGIGFAIPISLVKKVLPQLKSKGSVSRGYIGVLVGELTPEIVSQLGIPKDTQGPMVTNVYPGQPADKAGIKPYDVILEVNGKPIRNSGELIAAITGVTVNETVEIKIARGKEIKDFKLQVTQRPSSQELAKSESKPKKPGKKDKAPSHIATGLDLEDLTSEVAQNLGIPADLKGVVVTSVAYGSPADSSGLIRGDVILEVDRKPIKTAESFYSIVKEKKSYLLRIRRADPQNREGFMVIVLDLKGK